MGVDTDSRFDINVTYLFIALTKCFPNYACLQTSKATSSSFALFQREMLLTLVSQEKILGCFLNRVESKTALAQQIANYSDFPAHLP